MTIKIEQKAFQLDRQALLSKQANDVSQIMNMPTAVSQSFQICIKCMTKLHTVKINWLSHADAYIFYHYFVKTTKNLVT